MFRARRCSQPPWSFTNKSPAARDLEDPAPNATGVALLTTIVAGFDRAVVAGST